jgi:hypothetical protein
MSDRSDGFDHVCNTCSHHWNYPTARAIPKRSLGRKIAHDILHFPELERHPVIKGHYMFKTTVDVGPEICPSCGGIDTKIARS